jgi:translation initiation factor IF-3
LRINRQIRAFSVRVIGPEGNQLGVVSLDEALRMARDHGLDLVEVVPNAEPPVCKIVDFGKFRYDQTKREKESRKSQIQIKVKEVKLKPNIDEHDFQFKLKHAKEFFEKGHKVKITCVFRPREAPLAERIVKRMVDALQEVATPESAPKALGRNLTTVLAPNLKGKKRTAPTEGSGATSPAAPPAAPSAVPTKDQPVVEKSE